MGRIDRRTRIFLAEMLQGFLTGDYAKVAQVHFRAGYVAADQSEGAFIQAVRAIAEPIMGRPLEQISLARLLAQLFEVTETFRMETQPQLLLLQKSMLVCEGVGRKLAPEINMWTLAEPLVAQWIVEHRSPAARAREAAALVAARLDDLPTFVANLERATAAIAQGVKLDPGALAALGGRSGTWWWVLAALLLGVLLGRVV
jgi:ubiquinone biosynthesis protein